MSQLLNNALKIGSGILSALILASSSVYAQTAPDATLDQVNQYTGTVVDGTDPVGQVTNVDELQDVKNTDWAYEALKNIAERYNCLTTPQGKSNVFEGNRSITRYEFADGLNLCLQQVEKLIGNVSGDFIRKDDLQTLGRLGQEFDAELTTIRTRLDQVDGKVANLEKSQFSTTTKLNAEVIFNVGLVGGETKLISRNPDQTANLDDNQIFSDRVRLNFDSSFTGKDQLRIRLQARNTAPFNTAVTGTNMTRYGFDGNNANQFEIHRLEYQTPLSDKARVKFEANGGEFNDMFANYNPLFSDAGTGSISRFGRYAPIYRQSDAGAGVGFDYNFSKNVGISLGYLVPQNIANNSAPGRGLFNGSYAAMAQLNLKPSDSFNVGFTYVNSYNNTQGAGVNVSGSTGSAWANQPFGNIDTSANHFGLQGNYRFSPQFTLGAWVGYTKAEAEADLTSTNAKKGNEAELLNWAVNLGFSDFGKKGNLLGFIIGMPPKVISNDVRDANGVKTREDKGTSYHIEALYRYQVNNNMSITPGLLVILNPEHNDNADAVWVGTLRTTFKF